MHALSDPFVIVKEKLGICEPATLVTCIYACYLVHYESAPHMRSAETLSEDYGLTFKHNAYAVKSLERLSIFLY